MLGNGRLEAMCFDGAKRLCHIRGKLRKKVTTLCILVPIPSQVVVHLIMLNIQFKRSQNPVSSFCASALLSFYGIVTISQLRKFKIELKEKISSENVKIPLKIIILFFIRLMWGS